MKIRMYSLGNLKPVELGLVSTVFITGFTGIIILPFYLYLFGAGIFWEFFGIFVCMMIVWGVHSFKLMRYARRGKDIVSLPGYFCYRFGNGCDYLRTFSAIEICTLSIVITALIIKELCLILYKIFGLNQMGASFVIAIAVSTYIGKLGMEYLSKSAVYKAVYLVFAMVIITVYMYTTVGISTLIENMMSTKITGSVSEYLNILYHDGKPLDLQDYVSLISMGLLASGMPYFLGSFFAAKRARYIKQGRRIMMIFSIMLFVAGACFGGVTRGYLYPEKITNSLSEYIKLVYIKLMESSDAGVVFAIIFLLMVILGFVVTIEGAFHVTIISIYEDVFIKGRLIRISRKKEKRNIILTSLMTGLVVFVVSAYVKQFSISVILVFIGALGCSITPTMTLSLLMKNMNKYGCFAGLVGGLVSVPFFKYATVFVRSGEKASLCDVLGINSVVPSMVFTFCIIVLVSILTPKPAPEIMQEFEDVKNRISN